jgi:hypothetical protein
VNPFVQHNDSGLSSTRISHMQAAWHWPELVLALALVEIRSVRTALPAQRQPCLRNGTVANSGSAPLTWHLLGPVKE